MTTCDENLPETDGLQDADLAVDDLYDALASGRRRFVLDYLEAYSGPVQLGDLAVELACRDCDASPDRIAEDAVTSRRIDLHHVHLPKLAAAGIVEYEPDRKQVALADGFDDGLVQHLPLIE